MKSREGLLVREGAREGLSVREGAREGLSVREGAREGLSVREGAREGLSFRGGSVRFFRRKTVYISGGSSGIGLACARMLAPHAARITLIARNSERLARAKREIAEEAGAQGAKAKAKREGTQESTQENAGAQITTVSVDVGDAGGMRDAMERAMNEYGVPDVIVHSAGYAFPGAFESIDEARMRQMMDTNFFGSWNMMRHTVPRLQRGAVIIHIASFAALLGIFGYSAYSASKYAAFGLCEALRNELRPRGIAVKIVCPSDTDTPQLEYENRYKPAETKAISGTMTPYSARYVAHYALTHCRRRRFVIIPGVSPRLIWLLKRVAPRLVYGIIDRALGQYQARARRNNDAQGRHNVQGRHSAQGRRGIA